MFNHQPVLLEKVVAQLAIKPDGVYVDATFGRGGHTKGILEHLNEKGRVIVFDRDPDAIQVAEKRACDRRVTVCDAAFDQLLDRLDHPMGLVGKISGVLMDLGVSSPQLETPARGFSFRQDGPLDMRMNPRVGVSAAMWLNRASQIEIAAVLRDHGGERYATRIAKAIVDARRREPFTRTMQLVDVIARAVPRFGSRIHPATRCFQAIRIHVNDELGQLTRGLQQAFDVLGDLGRLVVISFHSLEDRLVKHFMKNKVADGLAHAVGKAYRADREEIKSNRRARSAVLRTVERCYVSN